MANLAIPLQNISFVEKNYLKKLGQLGIETVRDFLYYFPHRYDDFSVITKISDLKPDQVVTIKGKVKEIKNIRAWKRRMTITEAFVEDSSGSVRIVWFNQPFLVQNIKKEAQIRLSGKVNWDNKGLYLASPAYEMAKRVPTNTGRLVPVYSETRGITSRWLRWKISQLLKKYLDDIPELIPSAILKRQNLVGVQEAIKQLHFPDNSEKIKEAQKRMAFEEMFFIQLVSARSRKNWEASQAISIEFNGELAKNFVNSLPFKLTDAQRKASYQILKDLEKKYPMNRLLEGDVGSGKTVVAAIGALESMMAGYQTAIMAPTEVLAAQHFETFKKIFKNFSQKVGILTNSLCQTVWKKNTRKNFLGKIRR